MLSVPTAVVRLEYCPVLNSLNVSVVTPGTVLVCNPAASMDKEIESARAFIPVLVKSSAIAAHNGRLLRQVFM